MTHASDLIATDIDAYLESHQHKSLLRFITCGSVDDGKSTLIGRLLYDSKLIFEDQLAALEADSKRSGTQGGGGFGDPLRRDDHLYDFIVEIDHNSSPPVRSRGSGVFLHLARGNFGPTAGCVSMTKSAMLRLLARLGPDTRIVIG